MNKRIIIGFLLLSTTLLLTGCLGEKTLTCTPVDTKDFGNMKVSLKYKNDDVKEGTITYTFDYSSIITDDNQLSILNQEEYCSSMVEAFKSSNENLEDTISDCSESWEEKVLTVKMLFDVDVLNKKDNFKDLKTAQKTFEEDNAMKCTIK